MFECSGALTICYLRLNFRWEIEGVMGDDELNELADRINELEPVARQKAISYLCLLEKPQAQEATHSRLISSVRPQTKRESFAQ